MSFLKKLFGGGDKAAPVAKTEEPIDYKGYAIVAAPMADGGQFRVAGSISKDVGGEVKTHTFIRADVFADRDAAIQATIRKAQLIVDQSGDMIF
jgi:hypothetical protein